MFREKSTAHWAPGPGVASALIGRMGTRVSRSVGLMRRLLIIIINTIKWKSFYTWFCEGRVLNSIQYTHRIQCISWILCFLSKNLKAAFRLEEQLKAQRSMLIQLTVCFSPQLIEVIGESFGSGILFSQPGPWPCTCHCNQVLWFHGFQRPSGVAEWIFNSICHLGIAFLIRWDQLFLSPKQG